MFDKIILYMSYFNISQNGLLQIYGEGEDSKIEADKGILDSLKVQYDVISTSEINKRFKPLNFPTKASGIYDHNGGTLMASKCLAAVQVSLKIIILQSLGHKIVNRALLKRTGMKMMI